MESEQQEVRIIPVLSAQSTFDKAVRHLLKQGHPAIDPLSEECMYRWKGNKCAFGCFIPDDLYHEKFEGKSILMLAQDCPPLAPLINHHYKLLIALQNAHDVFFDTLDMLKEKLREIAVEFNLSNRAIK